MWDAFWKTSFILNCCGAVEVAIGKVGEKEIDFIATKMNEKKYIQVTDNMNAPETRARELAPLQAVQDNYEKIVIAMDCDLISDVDGIKIVKALDLSLIHIYAPAGFA